MAFLYHYCNMCELIKYDNWYDNFTKTRTYEAVYHAAKKTQHHILHKVSSYTEKREKLVIVSYGLTTWALISKN